MFRLSLGLLRTMITETPFSCPPIRTSIQAHSTSCEFTDRNLLDCIGLRGSSVTVFKPEDNPRELVLGTWRFEESNESSSQFSSQQLRISPTNLLLRFSNEWCGGGPYSPEPEPVSDPGPRLSIIPELVLEGETAVFTVTLSPTADGPVTVDWSTTDERIFPVTRYSDGVEYLWDDDAVAGADYVSATGTLTFQAGQSSRTFSVATLDDDVVEGEEIFRVVLSDPHGAAIIGPGAIGVILDLDDRPCLAGETTCSVVEIKDTYLDLRSVSLVVIGPDGERVEAPSSIERIRAPYVIDREGGRLTISTFDNEFYWRFIREDSSLVDTDLQEGPMM